jgi:hypothetical protein
MRGGVLQMEEPRGGRIVPGVVFGEEGEVGANLAAEHAGSRKSR